MTQTPVAHVFPEFRKINILTTLRDGRLLVVNIIPKIVVAIANRPDSSVFCLRSLSTGKVCQPLFSTAYDLERD
jgi:hypothetical protein